MSGRHTIRFFLILLRHATVSPSSTVAADSTTMGWLQRLFMSVLTF